MQDTSSAPAATSATSNPSTAQNTDPGFRVPDASNPASAPASAPAGTPPTTGTPQMGVTPVAGAPVTDTSTRDIAIGSVVFLLLLAVYFFVRNSYVHHLVVKRVAPSSAANAGWLLFTGLAFVSAAAVLALVNGSKFLNWAITGPLVLLGLVALVTAFFVGRR